MSKPKQTPSRPILTLPKPCHVAWDTMHAEDASPRRYCDTCEKHVHDLSAMTKREAEALLQASDWNICVNYEVNEDGEMLFQPEPPSRLMQQIQGAQKLLAAAALITPLALIQAACDEDPSLRLGGEPMPVAQSVEATGGTPTTPPGPGAGLEPTLEETTPSCDPAESVEQPAVEETPQVRHRHGGEAKPVEELKPEVSEPLAPPKHQRLGGAPRTIDYEPSPPDQPTKESP